MSGFFGAGVIPNGVVLGNLLAKGGQFGPIFRAPVAPAGNSVTTVINLPINSNAPFTPPPGNVYQPGWGENAPFQASGSPINPDPTVINGATLCVWGDIPTGGNDFLVVCLIGTWPQTQFIDCTFIDTLAVNYVLTTATAAFNAPYAAPGFTVWTWQPIPFPSLPFFGDQSVTFDW